MQIILSTPAGICFGVRDALQILDSIPDPSSVAIYGELVHNDIVLHQLETQGFHNISETNRPELPSSERIVITAHGISDRRRDELLAAGKTLIDTTCPLVARLHRNALDLAHSGNFVVIIGRPNHVEILGLTGDLESFAVVPDIASVTAYPTAKIGIIAQTTFPSDEAAAIRAQIEITNPTAEITWIDTICQPTKDRQQALHDLLDQVEAVVVVGGRRSHNTLRLVELCRQRGRGVQHVERADELNSDWFDDYDTVGLTAGTSTLPETLHQVHTRLLAIAKSRAHSQI
ncbi:MAG: 4-hydroxy-3-methylbut-2-enyl diphosphate reductase [Planctomycetaceae bacterium]|nr:4-hydroxy-3-methylbut-2-enyl diphosphate reductase [Planctomycetaceae bacterium]